MILLRRILRGPTLVKDKGYAWIVLALSFLSHILQVGFMYSVVGNLTIAHKSFFGITLQESSLIGSINLASFCLSGEAMVS